MELKDRFEDASVRIKSLTERPTNEELLNLYSLFKQGEEGDVHGPKPSMFNMKESFKYKAWENLKGMSNEEAMEKYIALVDDLLSRLSHS